MNDKVKKLAELLSVATDDLKDLAEALVRGDEWASFSVNAKYHGTRWAIGFELKLIQDLCRKIDEAWVK